MNEATKIALTKLSSVIETNRELLAVGKHDIDVTVNVKGHITVGEDYEATPTVSIPLKASLAHFIRLCGITRDVACIKLQQAMKAALEDEEKGEMKIREVTDIDEAMKKLQKDVLQKLPKMTKKGHVTVKLTVT